MQSAAHSVDSSSYSLPEDLAAWAALEKGLPPSCLAMGTVPASPATVTLISVVWMNCSGTDK